MKAIVLLAFLVILLAPAQAMPQMFDFTATPANAYLGESVVLSFICNSTNSPIQNTNASIVGPDLIIPNLHIPGNLYYSLALGRDYIDRVGSFTATAYCRDAEAETSSTASFNVASVTGGIVEVSPESIYTGDTLEIVFEMKKDGVPLTSSVDLSLFINGVQKDPRSIVYDMRRGWIIKADAPTSPGSYTLKIIGKYDRINVTSESNFIVKNLLEFTIESFDKSNVVAGDNVTVTLRAYNHGQVLTDTGIKIYLEGLELDKSITSNGGFIYAKITMPNVAPNVYNVRAILSYNGNDYIALKPIQYIIPVTGQFLDNGRAVSVQIRFLQSEVEKIKLITDAAGRFSGQIVPGRYDVEFIFPDATLRLRDASISQYNNSMGYAYITDTKVPGIVSNTIYSFSSFLSFSRAIIEIPAKDLDDDAKVFRCDIFGSDRKCRNSWTEANAYIDRARGIVKLEVDTLATFAIGQRESVSVNFNTEKKIYSIKEPIGIRGSTQDSFKNPIANAKMDVRLGNDVIGNLNSDNNGIFFIEFLAPTVEGIYNLTVYAEKSPYLKGEKSMIFEVQRVRSLSVLFSDTIRLNAGSNITKEITVVNTGQDSLNDLQLSIDGVPEEYYTIEKTLFSLPVNGEEKINILFDVPQDAVLTTFDGKLKLSSPEIDREKSFGFTIVEAKKDVEPATTAVTGLAFDFSLPKIDTSYIYLIVFALVLFTAAIAMKKMGRSRSYGVKSKTPSSTDNMNTLADIKNHIKSSGRKPVEKKDEKNG
jgi:hypothetical protein